MVLDAGQAYQILFLKIIKVKERQYPNSAIYAWIETFILLIEMCFIF